MREKTIISSYFCSPTYNTSYCFKQNIIQMAISYIISVLFLLLKFYISGKEIKLTPLHSLRQKKQFFYEKIFLRQNFKIILLFMKHSFFLLLSLFGFPSTLYILWRFLKSRHFHRESDNLTCEGYGFVTQFLC